MNIQVVEHGRPVDTSPAPAISRDVGLPDFNDGSSHPTRRDGWRWVPDPAEDQTSTPRKEGELWPSEALINALAWGSLHSWG